MYRYSSLVSASKVFLKPPSRGETDPELLGRKRELAEARRAIKLEQAESTYGVRERAKLETVADCDEVLKEVQSLRYIIIKNDFDAWSHYDWTKNLTEDECYKSNCRKAPGPPSCPRPSENGTMAPSSTRI